MSLQYRVVSHRLTLSHETDYQKLSEHVLHMHCLLIKMREMYLCKYKNSQNVLPKSTRNMRGQRNPLGKFTTLLRCAGCPRSGSVNDNRLQCKYRYKLAIKEAIANK